MEGNIQESQKSIIRVHRKKQFGAFMRSFKVIIDKKVVDRIWGGEIVEFDVEPGNHELFVKLDWCRSKKIKINVNPKETYNFVSGTINTYITLLFIIIFDLTLFYFNNKIIAGILFIIAIVCSFIPSSTITLKEEK